MQEFSDFMKTINRSWHPIHLERVEDKQDLFYIIFKFDLETDCRYLVAYFNYFFGEYRVEKLLLQSNGNYKTLYDLAEPKQRLPQVHWGRFIG